MKSTIRIMLVSGIFLAGMLSNSASSQTVIEGGNGFSMQNSTMNRIITGNGVNCRQCTIPGPVTAGGGVSMLECPSVGSVIAGSDVRLEKSRVLQGITAGDQVYLLDSQIAEGITAGGDVRAENSKIMGVIHQGGSHLRMNRSESGGIRFTYQSGNVNTGISSNSIIGNGVMLNGNVIGGHGGSSSVSMGSTGISSVNGYLVKTAEGRTTLIAPDQTIYVNGRKVSGQGPAKYEDYRKDRPQAPHIHAPGWPDNISSQAAGQSSSSPPPIVELRNHSIVNGDIRFEGLKGLIILDSDSRIEGEVVNGTVQKTDRISN